MKKAFSFIFCFSFLILTVSLSSFAAEAANNEPSAISHGIEVLSERGGVAMSSVGGSEIIFEADDFKRMMNLSHIESITVTEAPQVSEGELLLGSTVVTSGQTISAKNLGYLRYEHKAPVTSSASFWFSVDGAPYDVKCTMYILDKLNSAPTLSVAPESILDVSTHRNVMLYGALPCYDPDGDETRIEIVSYPKNGSLILTDRSLGEYTYLPSADYTGNDSFSYVAVDKYGNYSGAKKVTLKVNKPKTSVVFADMTNSPDYASALTVTEAGIMSGSQVGEHTYFYPSGTLTRAEFLVMAMKSVGINDVTKTSSTVFSDNSDIPEHLRSYVATAYELGYISGTYVDGALVFLPMQPITRAEAAVMICNMIDAATPTVTPVFSDSDEIPAFAASAVNSLSYMGILRADGGNISASTPITRGECAHLLAMVMRMSK